MGEEEDRQKKKEKEKKKKKRLKSLPGAFGSPILLKELHLSAR